MKNSNDSTNNNSNQKPFYDVDFEYDEKSSERRINHASVQNNKSTKDNQTSSKQLDQSIRKVKSLFAQAAEKNTNLQNPYKKIVRPTVDRSARKPVNNTSLPSPEEIRKERERRRKLRIAELEKLENISDVEKTHSHYEENGTENDASTNSNNADFHIEANNVQVVPHLFDEFAYQRDHLEPFEKNEHLISEENINQSNNIQEHGDGDEVESNLVEISHETDLTQFPTEFEHGALSRQDEHFIESVKENEVVQDIDSLSLDESIELDDDETTRKEIVSNNHEELEFSLEKHDNSSDQIPKESGSQAFDFINNEDDPKSYDPIDDTSHSVQTSVSLEDTLQPTEEDLSEQINSDATTESLDDNEVDKTMGQEALVLSTPLILGSEDAEANSEIPKRKSKDQRKKIRKAHKREKDAEYDLNELEPKRKLFFIFNVFFNVLKKFAIYLILIGLLGGALAGGIGAGYFAYLVSQTTPPTREEMEQQINRVEQQSTLYYANGEEIASVRADVVRTVTDLNSISPFIIDGLIATEDEYFYEHPGVVPKAILRATIQEILRSGSGTGGSTLTQQLVKQQMLTNDVTFFRKANEILLALRVENYFTKDEILTAYLNISPFGRNNNGDNVAGILSASEGIFGKKPSEVNLAQAAFLVGLPQDPYSYTPYDQYGQLRESFEPGIERMKEVLFRMYRTEKITKEQYDEALTYDITKDFLPTVHRNEERQTYLYQSMMNGAIEQIMRLNIADQGLTWDQVNADIEWYNEFYYNAEEQLRTGGYHVYTTIDRNIYDLLQRAAVANKDGLGVSYDGVYTNPDTGEETYYVESVQSGTVVIDNKTGRVLGFVAGTDYENNQIDHAFGMRRSPGSTLKPLAVYGPAIEHNLINPSTIIPDTSYEVTFEDGTTWTPTNYGSAVSGSLMTARNALLRSDNLPAVRIYEKLLENNVPISEYMQKLGFDSTDAYTKEDTSYLAFALGGVTKGPTVFEQTRAFTTIANNGQYIDGYYIDRIEDAFGNIVYKHEVEPVKVFSEDSNYLLLDMLRDTNTEGTGRTAAENMTMGGDWIAKSGISENSRDIWYIASTPSITIGTWIGYDNRYVDYYIDINDGYGRESERIQIYWAKMANDLYNTYPDLFGVDQTFVQPESVQRVDVLQNTGTLPGTINVNGTMVTVSQPLVNEVFKVSNPPKPLYYDFIFNGSEDDANIFWNTYVAQVQEALRRQRETQQSSSSSSTAETTSVQDESTAPPAETTVAPN